MSKPQEQQRPLFPFGNPFKMMLPKASQVSPKLLTMTNTFGITLALRLKNLKPKDMEDLLSLPWMRLAVDSLCETHTDIKTFINKLELPVCDWDEKWINVYFNNTVKILDICIAFSSELSRLTQGHLLLQYLLHKLETKPTIQSSKAHASLTSLQQHLSSKNPRLENCFNILDTLTKDLTSPKPKMKNSSKEKALMQALYGVQVHTLFVCNILVAGLTGSSEKLIDLHVPESFLWAEAFVDVQNCLNGEVRRILKTSRRTPLVKEIEAIDTCLKKLEPLVQDGDDSTALELDLEKSSFDLRQKGEKLSQGLDLMTKGVDGFFRIIMTGRDALLANLRADFVADSHKIEKYSVMKFQVVR